MTKKIKIQGDKLKKFYEQTMVCTSCGYCKSVCPAFGCTLWDNNTARSKVMLAYGLLKGDIEPDESVIKAIYECTTCADCARRCPSKVETLDIVMATRAELASLGLIPENLKLAINNTKEVGNPFGESAEKRLEFVPEVAKKRIGKGADVLLYLGCTASLQNMKMASSIFKIMEKSGINYTYLGEKEPCCGVLDYLAGYSSKPHGERLVKALESLKPRPKMIVTPCPGCFRSLSSNYPKEGIDLGVNVKHIIEYLNELIENGDLVVNKKLDGKVLYHDPCDLGRHSNIYDPPRKLLSHFTDICEFEYNRDKAHCCGGGGGLQSTNYQMTSGIAKKRVMEAIEQDADIIVTACPACNSTLSVAAVDLKKETGKKVKVKDIIEIVAKNTTGVE